MKRIIGVVAVISLLFCGTSHATGTIESDLWNTYEINNDSNRYITTIIPTTTIRPGVEKILGWTVQWLDGGSTEAWIAVYDANSSLLAGELLGETEALTRTPDGRWFTFPRKVIDGVAVRQGPYTKALIYFTSY